MSKKTDIIGKRYGRLFILENADRIWTHAAVKCLCDCGVEKVIRVVSLTINGQVSCGCYKRGVGNYKHGGVGTTEYNIWNGIKSRCLRKTNKTYKYYGGRGIDMCKEWQNDFECFIKDMGYRPSKEYSIDRIDNNKGYSKGNCRWATWDVQVNNKRVRTDFTRKLKELEI
jgi:hypothetical protein